MNYIGLILNLADNIVELYVNERKNRHRDALFKLRKRYENEKNKEKPCHNLLDHIELDIMHYCELLSFEVTKSKASDLQG
tara:strand:- start:269 stop:508 length:240 start_codon:yes stop_codon:yes gene_type:complete